MRFEIVKTCPETGARAGLLHTAHGTIETPVFMPVGTQGTVKALTPRDLLNDLDARIILANTYHLFLRPGHERIERFGGLHQFMSWPRAILTDSGGFQVFSLDTLRKVTDEGVLFRSHLNGDAHLFTPESTVDIQLAFGSDIVMVLDECLPYPADHGTALGLHAPHHPLGARRLRPLPASRKEARHCALFPIVQGSMYPDLRVACAEQLLELDAPGYAIGGLSVGEPRDLSQEMVAVTAPAACPPTRPRYVMGVGMPEELPQYVAQGVDMMDCVLPTPQRPQRLPVHLTRQGASSNRRATRTISSPRPGLLLLHLPDFQPSLPSPSFQAGEILFSMLGHTAQHPLSTLTSCAGSGSLFCLGSFRNS